MPPIASPLWNTAGKLRPLFGRPRWKYPEVCLVELFEPFAHSEYKVLGEGFTPDAARSVGKDHLLWQSHAYRCKSVSFDNSEGFARTTVNVPGKFLARAFPETSLNTTRPYWDAGWWWLSFFNYTTAEVITFLADPEYCTPTHILSHGENPIWFSKYAKYASPYETGPAPESVQHSREVRAKERELDEAHKITQRFNSTFQDPENREGV